MQSDGPYKLVGGVFEGSDGSYKITSDEKYIQAIKAQSYAEGRKSMEKDFQELLELANSMEFLAGCRSSARVKFDAWKKARGIE